MNDHRSGGIIMTEYEPRNDDTPVIAPDEIAAKDAEIRALNLRILALAESLALDHDHDRPALERLVGILKRRSLTDGGSSSDPETTRYMRGRCSAFREMADMLQTMIDAIPVRAATEPVETVAEACKPWGLCSGEPPDWDSPLMDVWQAAICWTLRIVGDRLGAQEWEGGDGSETLDGDVSAEVIHIMRAAGLVNEDGDPITRADIERLRKSPDNDGGAA